MTLLPSKSAPGRASIQQQGVATIVVLVILAVLTMLMVLNSLTLSRTKQEILLLERKHEQRLKKISPVQSTQPMTTNQPAPATRKP